MVRDFSLGPELPKRDFSLGPELPKRDLSLGPELPKQGLLLGSQIAHNTLNSMPQLIVPLCLQGYKNKLVMLGKCTYLHKHVLTSNLFYLHFVYIILYLT